VSEEEVKALRRGDRGVEPILALLIIGA